ncbi:hypothetical protein MBLNU459_g3419t1 [Dothideomycetes sp. NU459]
MSYDLTTEIGVLAYLQEGIFPSCTEITRLVEGFCGFVYRAVLSEKHADGYTSVIVKHVEDYAARAPTFKLHPSRLHYEQLALKLLPKHFASVIEPEEVGLPTVLGYDEARYTLVLQDLGDLPTLKNWSLARFLAKVHNTLADLTARLDGNDSARQLSALVYYGRLVDHASKFGYEDEFIALAATDAREEVLKSRDVLTIGDFWPGNVLISTTTDGPTTTPVARVFLVDLELCKPGTAAFDVGQMAAELYCRACFRDKERGTALLDDFLQEYKRSATTVDAAKVAIRVGAHLVIIAPNAWGSSATKQAIAELVREGIGLVRAGWYRDHESLTKSMVAPLLQ